MAKDTATEWVEAFIENPALSEGHRALIRQFMAKPAGDELSGDEVRRFVLAWVRELNGQGDSPAIDTATHAKLRAARLPWDLAVQEALLRRLPEDPDEALRYITERVEALSARNTANAQKERSSRRDLWSNLIDDCLDDNPNAELAEVIDYILEADGVEELAGQFHHVGREAEPIARENIRKRLGDAKRRRQRRG
jgi:hypothetical protein